MVGYNDDDGIYVYDANSVPVIKNNWIYENEIGIECDAAAWAAAVRNNTIVYNDTGIAVTSGTAPAVTEAGPPRTTQATLPLFSDTV